MNTYLSNKYALALAASAGLALLAGCASNKSCCGSSAACSADKPISKAAFGSVDGKAVELYTLKNKQGAIAKIMTYGGILQSLQIPDKDCKLVDVTLGYYNLDS